MSTRSLLLQVLTITHVSFQPKQFVTLNTFSLSLEGVFKIWAKPDLFLFNFLVFLNANTNIAQIWLYECSLGGVLGIRTRGGRMVGADNSDELWRHPRRCYPTTNCPIVLRTSYSTLLRYLKCCQFQRSY